MLSKEDLYSNSKKNMRGRVTPKELMTEYGYSAKQLNSLFALENMFKYLVRHTTYLNQYAFLILLSFF